MYVHRTTVSVSSYIHARKAHSFPSMHAAVCSCLHVHVTHTFSHTHTFPITPHPHSLLAFIQEVLTSYSSSGQQHHPPQGGLDMMEACRRKDAALLVLGSLKKVRVWICV